MILNRFLSFSNTFLLENTAQLTNDFWKLQSEGLKNSPYIVPKHIFFPIFGNLKKSKI
jgi:hypothetical protein